MSDKKVSSCVLSYARSLETRLYHTVDSLVENYGRSSFFFLISREPYRRHSLLCDHGESSMLVIVTTIVGISPESYETSDG